MDLTRKLISHILAINYYFRNYAVNYNSEYEVSSRVRVNADPQVCAKKIRGFFVFGKVLWDENPNG